MNKFALVLVLLVSICFLSGCIKTANELSNNTVNVTNETNYSEPTENFPPVREPVRMCETDADCHNTSYAINKCMAEGNDTYCSLQGYIRCSSNDDCKAPEGDYALCAFSGTVDATCYIFEEGVQPGQPMNCKKDSECNDDNADTYDTCAIVNESYSFCSHVTQRMK